MRFILFFICLSLTSVASANEAVKHYEQALDYLNAGKIFAAEVAVKNSLQLDLNYLPARLLLGKVLLKTGKYQAAEKEFERSLLLHADSFSVILLLVEVKLLLNKNEQALNFLAKHPQLKTKQQYYLLQGDAFKALAQYDKALTAYQNATSAQEKSVQMHTALADLWYQQENITKAQNEIKKALTLQSDYIPALLLSSAIYKKLAHYQQAEHAINLVLSTNKNNKQALFARAGLLLAQEKVSQALAVALSLRQLAPDDPYSKLLHSSIVAQQGQTRQARRILTGIKHQLSGIDDRHRNEQPILLLSATVDFLNSNRHAAKRKFLRYIELYGENSSARRYLAIITFRANQLDKAQLHIEKAIAQNSYDADIYLLAAEIYRQAKLPGKQLAILKKAKINFSGNDKVNQHYVVSLLDNGLFKKALNALDDTNENSSLQNKTVLAFMQLKSGLLDQARLTTQGLLEEYPDKVEVLQLAGELSLKTSNDNQRAIYFFEQALVLDESFTAALVSLAGIYLQQGKVDKVEKLYQKLLSIDQDNSLIQQLYADLAIKQGRVALAIKFLKPQAEANVYKAGRALLNLYIINKQAEQALALITNLEKAYPLDEALLLSKSRVQAQLGQLIFASKSLNILFGLIYDNGDKLITLAHAQLDIGDAVSANKSITRVKSLENITVPPYLQARYYLLNKEVDKAEAIIKQALNKTPASSGWLVLKVQLLIAQQKLAAATKIQTQLYQKHNTRDDLQLLARLYGQQGEVTALMGLLSGWLKDTPHDDWARSQLSALALSQGDKVLAISVLENAPNLAKQPAFMNNLASFYLNDYLAVAVKDNLLIKPMISFNYNKENSRFLWSIERLNLAISYAIKAYKLAPNIAAINDTLGWAYVHNGQLEKGLSLLREAIARDTNNGEIYYHLAFALAELNIAQQAQNALVKAIELAPDDPLRQLITNKINKL